MFGFQRELKQRLADSRRELQTLQSAFSALGHHMAVIEFTADGLIVEANANFCKAMAYAPAELKGQHHRIFCDPEFARSTEYA